MNKVKTNIKKLLFLIVSPLWVRLYLSNISNSLLNPHRYYGYCIIFFQRFLPIELKKHRIYFQSDRRSFGEDAFTVMWYLLYKKYKFKNFLEIGVYRGQVISLLGLMSKLNKREIQITGISPLTNAPDSVSTYIELDYEEDIRTHFGYFNLPEPKLVKEYSTSNISINEMNSKLWDCIYIDGSHDYDIVKQDFINTYPNLKKGGILVFDDSSLNLNKSGFCGWFKGHPGPSDVVDEIVVKSMKEILRVGHNRCFIKS